MNHSLLQTPVASPDREGALAGVLSRLRRVRTVDEKALRWTGEVQAARRGDRAAFETLVRGVQRPVYGLCLRLLSNESEAAEVAQETMLRAWQHLDRYDEGRSFEVWLLAIARNLCLDLLRRRSKVKVHGEDVGTLHEVLPSGAESQEDRVLRTEASRGLEEALGTLGATDREVLALYYVQKRTTKEIAGVLGVAPGTIMARLFRAREKLRRVLSADAEPKGETGPLADGVKA